MPFKDGVYTHESGFSVIVREGKVYLSENHPMTIRLSEVFDQKKWKVGE